MWTYIETQSGVQTRDSSGLGPTVQKCMRLKLVAGVIKVTTFVQVI